MSTIIFFQKHSSYKAFEHLIWYNINCRKEKLPLNFPFVLLFVYFLFSFYNDAFFTLVSVNGGINGE